MNTNKNFKPCEYGNDMWKIWKGESKCNFFAPNEKANFCQDHGCNVCNFVNLKGRYQTPPKDFKLDFDKGIEVCSKNCKAKAEKEYHDVVFKLIKKENQKMITQIKNTFAPFYDQIKEVNKQLIWIKGQILQGEVNISIDQLNIMCHSKIENHCSLTDSEINQWQEIYKNSNPFETFSQERDFLVPLAQKYKDIEEQNRKNNIPECKKCQLRREQPTTFPAGCEGWCKECIKQNQREEQTPNDNNDDYVPPVNDSPPVNNDNNTPSQDGSPTPSDNSGNGNDTPTTLSDNSPLIQVDNNKNNNQPTKSQKPTSPDNSSNRKSKTDTTTNQFQTIIKYLSVVAIPAFVVLIVYFLAKKKKNNWPNVRKIEYKVY